MTDPAARAAYLDGACGGDAGLRTRVEALLRAHDQPDSLLDHPAVAPHGPRRRADTRTDRLTSERPRPTDDEVPLGFLAPSTRPDSLGRIGHYEVLQVLGQGGFGIVFRAFDDVLQRVVAVKVLAPQMAATSPARKRFLREARSSAAGAARERGAGLRGRRAAAAVPGDGVHPRRDAPAAARPDRPARRARGPADRPADRRGAGRRPRHRPDPPRHQAGQHPARRRARSG